MKKITVLIATLLVLSTFICACGGNAETTTAAKEETTAAGQDTTQGEQTDAKFEAPVLLASVGASADISIAKSILDKVGIEYTVYENGADVAGYKSAILVPGVSVKGLGSAGISVEDELAATKALVSALKAANTPIVVAHLGGSSRRDELTDQFIDVVLPDAAFILALAEGNADNKFSDFASANGIPSSIDKDIVAVVTTITGLYK